MVPGSVLRAGSESGSRVQRWCPWELVRVTDSQHAAVHTPRWPQPGPCVPRALRVTPERTRGVRSSSLGLDREKPGTQQQKPDECLGSPRRGLNAGRGSLSWPGPWVSTVL
jgi:hypothetical protein